jgi:hypothetical protein
LKNKTRKELHMKKRFDLVADLLANDTTDGFEDRWEGAGDMDSYDDYEDGFSPYDPDARTDGDLDEAA